ncbi:MAG: hypothetical protein JRN06_06725 [Nitrososphaerota archaeon]|nr:hypothetical protein [Nitrososphaerota archaeon]MDG7024528.1 hypothetical protein [Nitrososphaerota archaeon]
MSSLPRVIQGLIIFSAVLGVVFLWQAYPLLPSDAFGFVAFGWVLFVIDSCLTFIRPMASYYLGIVLAVMALGATLSQPAHFALVGSGGLLASATIILGSAAEALLVVVGAYYVITRGKKDPWEWPGAESQA